MFPLQRSVYKHYKSFRLIPHIFGGTKVFKLKLLLRLLLLGSAPRWMMIFSPGEQETKSGFVKSHNNVKT